MIAMAYAVPTGVIAGWTGVLDMILTPAKVSQVGRARHAHAHTKRRGRLLNSSKPASQCERTELASDRAGDRATWKSRGKKPPNRSVAPDRLFRGVALIEPPRSSSSCLCL